jgi:4-coumarate--CoA ligase
LAPAVFYGVIAAGGVFSAASHSFTAAELARQIRQGQSNLVVCSEDLKHIGIEAAKICRIPVSRVIVFGSEPPWTIQSADGAIPVRSDKRLSFPKITDPDELKKSLIMLLWSSGTTGVPKGVMLSHLNMVAELYIPTAQAREWAASLIESGELVPGEMRTVAHLPIAHIAGIVGYLVIPVLAGATVYWMRKFEWKSFIEYSKKYKITALYTVPSIFLRIAKSPDVTDHFKYVESASTGAALMDEELQKAANAKLGSGATFIGQTWGLSETTGAVTAMPKGEMDDTGSISPVLPNMQMR